MDLLQYMCSLAFTLLSVQIPLGMMTRDVIPDPAAKTLFYHLMKEQGYNALIRPSAGPQRILTVRMGLRLSQVLEVDEKNQILRISVWLRQEWYDTRLKWDPSDYGGVKVLNIPSEDLWKPDLVLYNNADGDFQITLKTKAIVHYTGKIVWEPPAIYKSYCPIDVEFFPFDIQQCFLKFSFWTYHGNELDLQHLCNGTEFRNEESPAKSVIIIPRGIDLTDYYYNVEWDVLNVTAMRKEKFYPCCPEPYPHLTFNITLRRRTLFYTLNLIMPCVSISCLTVLVFYLPSDSGEKITLSISILLALTVFFLLLSDMNPPTSLVIPLIGKYLLFIMIVVTMSITLTVYTLHINFKSPTTHKMSPWVRRIFTEILPRILLMERPELNKKPKVSVRTVNGIEVRESVGRGEPAHTYMNVRSRDESAEPEVPLSPHYPPEVMEAISGVTFIANHLRQGDEDVAEERDWKYIAMVMDRFFLYIFTTACFCGTLSIFLYAPSLYDPREHMALIDPNNKCIY